MSQDNFSKRATSSPRPSCFYSNQISNLSASIKADIILRVRLFSSRTPHHVLRWLSGAEQSKDDISSIIAANLIAFIYSAKLRLLVLLSKKWKMKIESSATWLQDLKN